jgi:hypothetical protein
MVPTFVAQEIGQIDVSLRRLNLYKPGLVIDVVDLVSRWKNGGNQTSVFVVYITVGPAYGGLVSIIAVDLVVTEGKINGYGNCYRVFHMT